MNNEKPRNPKNTYYVLKICGLFLDKRASVHTQYTPPLVVVFIKTPVQKYYYRSSFQTQRHQLSPRWFEHDEA
jgi:hypothetical protein